jgi:hypothetical protein
LPARVRLPIEAVGGYLGCPAYRRGNRHGGSLISVTPAQRLEARTLELVTLVLGGNRVEDSLVECKSAWLDPPKASRRLAAHANSARDDHILWIVGLDEDAGEVQELEDSDPARWWGQVQSHFSEVAPDLVQHLTVPTESGVVVALQFATDRAP